MKQLNFLLVLSTFLLSSCASVTKQLNQIPNTEFQSFSYHRSGNVTSASVIATNAKKENDKLSIESISIQTNYGPFLSVNLELRGYKRDVPSVMNSAPGLLEPVEGHVK